MDTNGTSDKIKVDSSLLELCRRHCYQQQDNHRRNPMGKCVSKHPSAIATASSDSEVYLYDQIATSKDTKPEATNRSVFVILDSSKDGLKSSEQQKRKLINTTLTIRKAGCGLHNVGQSESKKSSKKTGQETKGTAMSFGFRKKLLTTPKKKKGKGVKVDGNADPLDLIVTKTHMTDEPDSGGESAGIDNNFDLSDKNGNSGRTTATALERREETQPVCFDVGAKMNGATSKGNRFGFRATNTVRPASTGITPKFTDFQDSAENNNNNNAYSSTAGKRRSKSAHTARTLTSNRTHDQQWDPKINQNAIRNSNHNSNEYQRRQQLSQNIVIGPPQYTHTASRQHPNVINTGMHTNVIVKPTARPPPATTFSKFTLHTASLPKPQYPVPVSLNSSHAAIDTKSAKQMVNNNRKGFGPREISNDSGISGLGTSFDSNGAVGGHVSPKRFKNRPRNLQMVMSGRHKFEVRDLDDSLSSESPVEPLALPKLPSAFSSTNQTIPLSGLVRTNTILERETVATDIESGDLLINRPKLIRNISDVENAEEEKLFLDRSTSEKNSKIQSIKDFTNSSKNSSPGSSRASWCNAGESLAIKDCSSMSSSDESKDNREEKRFITDDISQISMPEKPSSLSSLTESAPPQKCERPKTLSNITETKFAEMAASVTDFLLDDETSPTDSLVSSTESDEAMAKKHKRKLNEGIQEKDIDEISPELEVCSPITPGTPTHASNSLSLSDGGRDFLIDDEIADQPALLFNDTADAAESTHLGNSLTDTPTLRETGGSIRSTKSNAKTRSVLQAAIEFSLRTPVSLRRAVLDRCESLDTLSPCESIASDDLMMDFDVHSSMDSIDRMSVSMKSRSGSAIHPMDGSQFMDFETKSGDMIREWNNILRVNRTERDSISSHLPARATRLLNRSRLQQCQLSNNGSDSPKSNDSMPRRTPSSRTSSIHHSHRDATSSSDDLLLYDKSFRNSMLQEVQYFKKQAIMLRRILQESETLNPFDLNNGQLFASCGLDSKFFLDDKDLGSLTSSSADEPMQELTDLRRQVVYLQGQIDDRDRIIRMNKNLIDRLEAEADKTQSVSVATSVSEKECVNSATQTDRVRPLSIGPDGLSRSKPEYTSYITHFPAIITDTTVIHSPTATTQNQTRRHTIISTTFTNFNQVSHTPRRSSIGYGDSSTPNAAATLTNGYKPVKITLIGDPLPKVNNNDSNENRNVYKWANDDQRYQNHVANGETTNGKCHPHHLDFNDAERHKPSVTIV